MKARNSGFTLIELLIGIAIAAFGIIVTANVAAWAMASAGRGQQRSELSTRMNVVGRQLQADLELTGMGTTGAIGVNFAQAPLGAMSFNTPPPGNRRAIASVHGANNVNNYGGTPLTPGSDIMQVVVPDPSTARRTFQRALLNDALMILDPIGQAFACNSRWAMVIDSSGANGAGRSQLIGLPAGGVVDGVAVNNNLVFGVMPNSHVMCARVSTYFLDVNGNLRRADLGPPGAGTVAVTDSQGRTVRGAPPLANMADLVSPGLLDFQVAYAFSAEFAPAINNRLAFHGGPSLNPQNEDFFEVRQVRIQAMMRSLRPLGRPGAMLPEANIMDAPFPRFIAPTFSHYNLDIIVGMSNLRYFDRNTPSGTRAEPF